MQTTTTVQITSALPQPINRMTMSRCISHRVNNPQFPHTLLPRPDLVPTLFRTALVQHALPPHFPFQPAAIRLGRPGGANSHTYRLYKLRPLDISYHLQLA